MGYCNVVGAKNRVFLFKNGGVGIDLLGEFHYIDYGDLSSFKIPLTFDGNAMNQACRSLLCTSNN